MLVSFQSYLTGVVTGAVNCSPGMLLPEMTSATSSDVGTVKLLPMPLVQVSVSTPDSG